MWMAANFIIEGRMQPAVRPQVVHRCSSVYSVWKSCTKWFA